MRGSVFLGLALVFCVFVVGCGGSGGGGSTSTSAQPLKPKGYTKAGAASDPDQLPEASNDVAVTVSSAGVNKYRLTVLNTSHLGFLNTFTWSPPGLMTIVSVGKASTGNCALQDNLIRCNANLKPPTCSCKPDGGTLNVTFSVKSSANPKKDPRVSGGSSAPVNYGLEMSNVKVYAITPVPYIIPTSAGAPAGPDAPKCGPDQTSTILHPCSTGE